MKSKFPLPDRNIKYLVKTIVGDQYPEYDLDKVIEDGYIPDRPDGYDSTLILEPSDPRYGSWHNWELYQQALEQRRIYNVAYEDLLEKMGFYILDNCVNPKDRRKVQTKDDLDAVYVAAVPPRIYMDDIRKAADSLSLSYKGQNIVDAVMNGDKSDISGDIAMILMAKLMTQSGLTSDSLFEIKTMEIAVKVAASEYDDWSKSLSERDAFS